MTRMEGLRKPQPCTYCMDDKGEPQGFTLILGHPVKCPACMGTKIF